MAKRSSSPDLARSGYESFEEARRALIAAGYWPSSVTEPQRYSNGDGSEVVLAEGIAGEVFILEEAEVIKEIRRWLKGRGDDHEQGVLQDDAQSAGS